MPESGHRGLQRPLPLACDGESSSPLPLQRQAPLSHNSELGRRWEGGRAGIGGSLSRGPGERKLRLCGDLIPEPSLLQSVVVSVAMASRLLRGAGALAVQTLRASGPARMAVRSMAKGGGIPSDEEQATGLEREIMMAARNDLDPYNMYAPKAAPGTQEEPNLVPSITDKRIVGCICEEDNSAVIWFWLHKGETQRCPNCGTHYKLIPHQLGH